MSLSYVLAAHFADDPSLPADVRRWGRGEKGAVPAVLPVDDVLLLSRVAAGDTAAFEALFRRYRSTLCAFATRYTRSPEAAEDLVHDVFLWLWQHAARVELRGTVRGYLLGATRHRALDAVARRAVADRAHALDAGAFVADAMVAPDAVIEGVEVRASVRHAIAALTERRREVITLRWGYQLSFAEIAQTLGVSVRTAETTHLRAMDDLRRLLAGVVN